MRRFGDDVVDGAALLGPPVPWPAPWTTERVIRTLEPLTGLDRQAKLKSVISRRVGSVTVLMDAPHDPHNGAAILRSSEAFGLPEIHVVPRVEDFRLARTVTRGCEQWVDAVLHPGVSGAVSALRSRGFELIATHPEGELVPEDLARLPRLALLLGNEHDGLCEELAAAADRSVRIPMRGFVESLNVSVAAAILLDAATRGRAGDLTGEEQRFLYAKALFRSVRRAGDVLAAVSEAERPPGHTPGP